MIIQEITVRKILASLGDETIEVTLKLPNMAVTASVPAGISAGKYEVRKSPPDIALQEIAKLNVLCQGKDWTQESLDAEITKYGFGGNTTLAVSAAFFKGLFPISPITTFPKLLMLTFEGGEHGNRNITIQEFLVLESSLSVAKQDFQKVRDYLTSQNGETTVGAEGGFSPVVFTNDQVLGCLASVLPDKQIALDIAGSFVDGSTNLDTLLTKFNIISVEDPFDDESWDKWQLFTAQHAGKLQVVGDDLTATNTERIQTAITKKALTAVIIKPNQIGTITQARKAADMTHKAGLKVIVSHRGEETDDTWIADFALATQADYVKFGGFDRGERVAKYNRLAELGMI